MGKVVHKINEGMEFVSLCGLEQYAWIRTWFRNRNWAKVTCKRCLKTRKKMSAASAHGKPSPK